MPDSTSVLRRQIVLLASLSSSNLWRSAKELLALNPFYGLPDYVVRQPMNQQERDARKRAKERLEEDIADLNIDFPFVEVQNNSGGDNRYRLNVEQMQKQRVFFFPDEAACLEVALKFLEGKHQILQEKIRGLTISGSRDSINFNPLLKIPLTVQQMYQAILERRRVSFEYKNRDGEISHPQNFEPWKLYFHRGFFYVQGKSAQHLDAPVIYQLQRFQSEVHFQRVSPELGESAVAGESYEIPASIPRPELDYYLDEPLIFAIAPNEALELRQKSECIKLPQDALSREQLAKVPAGWEVYRVGKALRYSWYHAVLEFLDKVVVISPLHLRKDLITAASHLQQNIKIVKAPKINQLKPENKISGKKTVTLHKDNRNFIRTRFQAICSFIYVNTLKQQALTYGDVANEFGIPISAVKETMLNAYEWGYGKYGLDGNIDITENPAGLLHLEINSIPGWVRAFNLPSQECIPLILSLEVLSRYLPAQRQVINRAELKVLHWYLQDTNAKLETLGVDELSSEVESRIQILNQAIKTSRMVSFTYVDALNNIGKAEVCPVELKAVRTRVELEAYNPEKRSRKWRTYWLERMQNLEILEEKIPQKLSRHQDKSPCPVFVKLDTKALPLTDQIVEATVYRRTKNTMWVQLAAYNEDWLTRQLLGFGQNLLQISQSDDFPEVLTTVAARAKRALENYQV